MGEQQQTAQREHSDWQCPTCRLAARARDSLYAMPNNPLIVAAVQALCAGGQHARMLDGGWRRTSHGAPLFEFWSGSGGRIRVGVDAPAEDAWQEIESYSPLTLDVAVALLVGLAADPYRPVTASPRRQAVWLGVPAIVSAKGYKRYGVEREMFAADVEREIAKVLRLRFDIANYPGFDPATRRWNKTGISRRDLALVETSQSHRPADDRDCTRGSPLRFGAWADHWLNASGAMWVSPLPQAILRLDHRDNRGADTLAKKAGVLLALNWGAARRNEEIRLELRVLLRRIGELRRPGATQLTHAGRLADRVEEAILRLSESSIMPNKLKVERAVRLRAANRRWFEQWLGGEVVFSRPNFLQEESERRRGRPAKAAWNTR